MLYTRTQSCLKDYTTLRFRVDNGRKYYRKIRIDRQERKYYNNRQTIITFYATALSNRDYTIYIKASKIYNNVDLNDQYYVIQLPDQWTEVEIL